MNELTKANAMRVAIHAQSDVGILQQALLVLVDEMESRDNGDLSVYNADGVEHKIWNVLLQKPDQMEAVKVVQQFLAEYPGVLDAVSKLAPVVAPSEWEYATTTGPRKSWDDPDRPPEDDGTGAAWEKDPDRGRPGESWDRFDYHEESYWRRWIGPGPRPEEPS